MPTLSTVKMSSPASVAVLVALCYLLLVQFLRFRRLRKLEKKYANLLHDPYSMSYSTAQDIMRDSVLNEMPFMNATATQYGLLKTYGIASGTKLLVQTRQIGSQEKVGKRVEDTVVLLSEIVVGDMDSERARRALSKVNWLHSRYKKVISNDEMLHTLSVFMIDPIRFIEKYEWRKLTQLEKVAKFVYWREIGLRMGIRDIPPTLEAFDEWVVAFEEHDMVFSENNRICMDTTVGLSLRTLPKFTHGFVKNVAAVFLEENVLRAVGWPDPPNWVKTFVFSILHIRAWMLRNLFLPRLWNLDPLSKMEADGRLYRNEYAAEPWYMKDTMWTRWTTWLKSGGTLAPGKDFKSGGYLPEELGPPEFEKASREPVKRQAEAMGEYVARTKGEFSGCPFGFGDELRWQ